MLAKKNKKGAIGQTITWLVGTIVIFLVLLIFLVAVYSISAVKSLKDLVFGWKSETLYNSLENYDEKKSESAFLLTQGELKMSFNNLKVKIGMETQAD